MSLRKFFDERKLRKIPASMEKVSSSIKMSEKFIFDAEKLFIAKFYGQSALASYSSMFHAARAILYRDGIQEKSHYAIYAFLKEKYKGKLPAGLIESFLSHQAERKEILYGFDAEPNKGDAEKSLKDARLFLEKVKELLE